MSLGNYNHRGLSKLQLFVDVEIEMSDEYQVQNEHQYFRKTYKNKNAPEADYHHSRDHNTEVAPSSPRKETLDSQPGCSCNRDTEGDIASILHKKCPVITLAQQQLQRLLDTDGFVCSNVQTYGSFYDFLRFIRQTVSDQSKNQFIILVLIVMAFSIGLTLGACSCGSYLGRFESPILTCLDNMFISDNTAVQETLRSIF